MNTHQAAALLHHLGQLRRRIGRKLQIAARFMRHGQTRTEKPSGAQRRYALRWGGRYRFDKKAGVWRLQSRPQGRVPRGRTSNPTALP